MVAAHSSGRGGLGSPGTAGTRFSSHPLGGNLGQGALLPAPPQPRRPPQLQGAWCGGKTQSAPPLMCGKGSKALGPARVTESAGRLTALRGSARGQTKIPGPEFWGFGPGSPGGLWQARSLSLPLRTSVSPPGLGARRPPKLRVDRRLRWFLPPVGPRPPGPLRRRRTTPELRPPQPGICTQELGAETRTSTSAGHCRLRARGAAPPAGRGAGTGSGGGARLSLRAADSAPCGRTSVRTDGGAQPGPENRVSVRLHSGETQGLSGAFSSALGGA